MVCWSEATADAVRAKMESVRLSNNFSLPDFSELLGLPYESTYQNIVVRDRGILSLDLYLRFCYLFGYDIEAVTTLPPRQSALDRAIYELAALFSSCTLAGLYELANSTERLKKIPLKHAASSPMPCEISDGLWIWMTMKCLSKNQNRPVYQPQLWLRFFNRIGRQRPARC